MLFQDCCFPAPPSGTSKSKGIIKINRKLSTIHGEFFKTYDVRFTEYLNLELKEEDPGKGITDKKEAFKNRFVTNLNYYMRKDKSETVGLNGDGSWWVVDIYTLI